MSGELRLEKYRIQVGVIFFSQTEIEVAHHKYKLICTK